MRTFPTTVLLVDDEAISNFINAKVVEKYQRACRIKIALNGKEALDHVRKLYQETGFSYDVVITDLNMPVMDGFTFIQELRRSGLASKSRLAIVSSSVSDEITGVHKL